MHLQISPSHAGHRIWTSVVAVTAPAGITLFRLLVKLSGPNSLRKPRNSSGATDRGASNLGRKFSSSLSEPRELDSDLPSTILTFLIFLLLDFVIFTINYFIQIWRDQTDGDEIKQACKNKNEEIVILMVLSFLPKIAI